MAEISRQKQLTVTFWCVADEKVNETMCLIKALKSESVYEVIIDIEKTIMEWIYLLFLILFICHIVIECMCTLELMFSIKICYLIHISKENNKQKITNTRAHTHTHKCKHILILIRIHFIKQSKFYSRIGFH